MMALQTRAFQRDGLRLNVAERGTGAPVIFQHGLLGGAAQTAEAFPEDPRFRLVTLECRGHGASEAGSENLFSIKRFAGDVAALIEHENWPPVVIGGISMGAAIALRLAVHRPQLVKALMLVRPAWCTALAPINMAPNGEVGRLLHSLPPAEARQAFLAGKAARRLAIEAPGNLASLTGFFERRPIVTTAALLQAIAADGPGITGAQVAVLSIPVLIVASEQDSIHPMAHAEALHRLMPHSRLVRITPKGQDKSSHFTELRRALLAFLEETAR